jgi:E3 ubiquitin-protein ligase MARCH5
VHFKTRVLTKNNLYIQVAGHDEGWKLMEGTDPLLLLVSLPLIPLGLFIGKMVRWQEPVLKVNSFKSS